MSNFQIEHLDRVIEATGVTPTVNQVELHPRLQLEELRRFHDAHDIATDAWSPLGRGQILDDPVIGEVASSIGRTPAQVVLRWHIQLGNIVIPRSVRPARIEENFQLFDFELDEGGDRRARRRRAHRSRSRHVRGRVVARFSTNALARHPAYAPLRA